MDIVQDNCELVAGKLKCFIEGGEYKKAIELAIKYDELAPLLLQYFSTNNLFGLAEKLCDQFLQKYGSNVPPAFYIKFANILEIIKNIPKKRKILEFGYQESKDASILLAICQQDIGEKLYDQAISNLRVLEKINELDSVKINSLFAKIYVYQQNYELAKYYLNKIEQLEDHSNDDYIVALILFLIGTKNYSKALCICNELLQSSDKINDLDNPNLQYITAIMTYKLMILQLTKDHSYNSMFNVGKFVYRANIVSIMKTYREDIINAIMNNTCNTIDPLGRSSNMGGVVSGELLIDNQLSEFKQIIYKQAQNYIDNSGIQYFSRFKENIETKLEIRAWAVITKNQASQLPHIHPSAFFSGVFYLQLPENKSSICFGKWPETIAPNRECDYCSVHVKEFDLVFFPSFYWHHTEASQSNKNRIAIAFDFIRK